MSENAALAKVFTGTMGWAYDDWRGPFYSSGLAQAKMLTEFARILPTVELDTTFFGVPRTTTLDGWASQTPPDFKFSAKVPKVITHERRLHHTAESALEFGLLLREHLKGKLAALLLQLPPDFSASETDTLFTFLNGVSGPRQPTLPWVVEVRHSSWTETNLAMDLAERGIACAATERVALGGLDPALRPPLRYVRLLGTQNSVARFDERQFDRTPELAEWSAKIDAARVTDANAPIYVYVRNFYEGHAPASLQVLREQLHLPPFSPPGQQQMSLF